ncbi:ParB N-terminal domain-containing protein [Thermosulfurimonas sp. F29]|uniref:ParB N-terminal domain-containing protein n=1 Tax=Thermosulfurimonas sp. F29 TaxID=2867247 RepID=UPI001C82D4B1|nr:ParB N-terminal domain-containing protein [Thermosulfurimonas sp. F29]MBX6423376.1 ParB N-terminal domain-containing protein [Thermosulfurimonas sp. F29]
MVEYRQVNMLQVHPVAKEFPPMPPETFEALVRQIKETGDLLVPIVTMGTVVLDGHHRLKAAREAGLEKVPVVDVRSLPPNRLLQTLVSLNCLRRNLDTNTRMRMASWLILTKYVDPLDREGLRKLAKWIGVWDYKVVLLAHLARANPELFKRLAHGQVKWSDDEVQSVVWGLSKESGVETGEKATKTADEIDLERIRAEIQQQVESELRSRLEREFEQRVEQEVAARLATMEETKEELGEQEIDEEALREEIREEVEAQVREELEKAMEEEVERRVQARLVEHLEQMQREQEEKVQKLQQRIQELQDKLDHTQGGSAEDMRELEERLQKLQREFDKVHRRMEKYRAEAEKARRELQRMMTPEEWRLLRAIDFPMELMGELCNRLTSAMDAIRIAAKAGNARVFSPFSRDVVWRYKSRILELEHLLKELKAFVLFMLGEQEWPEEDPRRKQRVPSVEKMREAYERNLAAVQERNFYNHDTIDDGVDAVEMIQEATDGASVDEIVFDENAEAAEEDDEEGRLRVEDHSVTS